MTFSSGEVLTAANLNALDINSLVVDTTTLVVDAANNRVGIGTATPMRTLDVYKDVVWHNGVYANLFSNESDGELSLWQQTSYTSGDSGWNREMRIGQKITGFKFFNCQMIYDRTTASGSTVKATSDGLIRRSSSSLKYKTDVEDLWDSEADKLLNLRPVWYRSSVATDRSDWAHEGLIAEEVSEINSRWVGYGPVWETDDNGEYLVDDNGDRLTQKTADGEDVLQPEDVHYERLVPALVNVVQRQQTQIDALTARIEALEA